MFYLPKDGGMWDPTIVFFKDAYYMFSMYVEKEAGKWDGMWLAKSADGVHWESIGRVLADDAKICKMFVHEVNGSLIINYGSFSGLPNTDNDTLTYYQTADLQNYTFLYKNRPDERWYHTEGRWDHMYVLHDDDGKYYGYVVATPKTGFNRAWGLQVSENGIDFETKEPPVIEWGDVPKINCLEGGGCEKIGDKYYYIGGYVGYDRSYGYGLYTFTSDTPYGPFRPDKEAFRLCGFSRLPGRVFIQNLACFCRGKEGELLVSNAVDAGGTFQIWLLPLRKAVTDENGHLRLAYWQQNELVKGEKIQTNVEDFKLTFADRSGTAWNAPSFSVNAEDTGIQLQLQPEYIVSPTVDDHTILVGFEKELDIEKGMVIEGILSASIQPEWNEITNSTLCWRPSTVGIAFGEGNENEYLAQTLEVGHPYKRNSYVEQFSIIDGTFASSIVDTTGEDAATVKGIDQKREYEFKLFYRKNMIEWYVGGYLVQTFVHLKPPSGKIAFFAQNASLAIKDLKFYKMNL